MYAYPEDMTLFDKYQVKYVYIGKSERETYAIESEDAFLENFALIEQLGDISLYQRKE